VQVRVAGENPVVWSHTQPLASIYALMPLFVTRIRGRLFSTARKIALERCCRITGVGPRYPSFEILISTAAPSFVNVRATAGCAASMQIKTPTRKAPRGISVYELPGVKSPTIPRTELAPGNQ